MQVTNTTREPLSFLKKGFAVNNGVPETVGIQPGETVDIDVDPEDAQVKGALFVRSLIEGSVEQQRKPPQT